MCGEMKNNSNGALGYAAISGPGDEVHLHGVMP
jgi:hypothetical protein